MATKGKLKQAAEQATKNITGTGKAIATPKPFTKPSGDYYRLDLVKRKVVMGTNKHPQLTSDIDIDYKAYLDTVRGRDSITAYIHKLLDEDMKKNKGT